jgi:hypothetical protein
MILRTWGAAVLRRTHPIEVKRGGCGGVGGTDSRRDERADMGRSVLRPYKIKIGIRIAGRVLGVSGSRRCRCPS